MKALTFVTKTEHEALANLAPCPITSTPTFPSISYAFSFPLCDLLICEFPKFVTNSEQSASARMGNIALRYKESRGTPRVTPLGGSVRKLSRVAHYIYQKVVRRKAIPYQPSPKHPEYLLCYVEEELECGHKVKVFPDGVETLTARKRNCHECSSWFGGLKLPEGKKPNASILRSYERIKKNSKGMAKWAILLFAGCCFGFMALLAVSHQPHIYTFTAPQDTFRVIAQDSDFNFVLQQVHEGVPQKEAVYHFCPSQPMPRFQIGETLDQLIYEDKGECQQLARGIPYIIERDETLPGHWPKLAGNCVNLGVKQPVVCDGKPQF